MVANKHISETPSFDAAMAALDVGYRVSDYAPEMTTDIGSTAQAKISPLDNFASAVGVGATSESSATQQDPEPEAAALPDRPQMDIVQAPKMNEIGHREHADMVKNNTQHDMVTAERQSFMNTVAEQVKNGADIGTPGMGNVLGGVFIGAAFDRAASTAGLSFGPVATVASAAKAAVDLSAAAHKPSAGEIEDIVRKDGASAARAEVARADSAAKSGNDIMAQSAPAVSDPGGYSPMSAQMREEMGLVDLDVKGINLSPQMIDDRLAEMNAEIEAMEDNRARWDRKEETGVQMTARNAENAGVSGEQAELVLKTADKLDMQPEQLAEFTNRPQVIPFNLS